MSGSKILTCTCKNNYQDEVHGKQKRVFNHAPSKGAKPNRYRCTSCKLERTE